MATTLVLLVLLVGSLVSALVPVVNAEALVLAAAAALPPELAAAVAAVAATGQMGGKVVLYRAGRGLGERTSAQSARAMAIAARVKKSPRTLSLLFFSSALVGLPPLYLMAAVAGVACLPMAAFLALGFGGRFARFWALAALPGLL